MRDLSIQSQAARAAQGDQKGMKKLHKTLREQAGFGIQDDGGVEGLAGLLNQL